MSQNYYFYDNRTQNVNSDQTSLAATLMSRPTSTTTNTFTSCSASRTTHSIENSQNNISSSSNIDTTSHKKNLSNPALVKRKHYSKKYVKEMKNCNSLVFGLAIASLSVVFYIFGAIHFTLLLIDSEENLRHNNTLPIILISICLVMSIVSILLIVGIVKRRHVLMIPWIISAIVGIISDVVYLIALLTAVQSENMIIESISYLIAIAIQLFVFRHIYLLYKDLRRKFIIQQEHKVIWSNNQQFMEN